MEFIKKMNIWWWRIAAIMLFEFVLLDFIYTYGEDKALFTHFSFASTITSIILAVVAIIYGFIQSSSQQSSSERIAKQVESLRFVVGDIESSKTELNSELSRIDAVLSRLDEMSVELCQSKNEISSLHKKLDEFPQLFKSRAKSESFDFKSNGIGNAQDSRNLIVTLPTAIQLVLITLFSLERQRDVVDTVDWLFCLSA